MKLTKGFYVKHVEDEKVLREKAKEIGMVVAFIQNPTAMVQRKIKVDKITFNTKNVRVVFNCGIDYGKVRAVFPATWLWTKNFKQKLVQYIQKKTHKKATRKYMDFLEQKQLQDIGRIIQETVLTATMGARKQYEQSILFDQEEDDENLFADS